MEKRNPITQKLRKGYGTDLEVAMHYYGLISVLNDIHLTTRELQLLAFTAIKGCISSGGAREEFVRKFHSSKGTVNNMIADLQKLEKKHVLVKSPGGKITVNPKIVLDFSSPITLHINLSVDAANRQTN